MRYSTRVLIFLIFLNAAATAFSASGVAADWGIEPDPGGDAQLANVEENASSFQPSGGFAATLYGLYASVTGVFQNVIGVATAGPTMIGNLGVPGWVTAFAFAPLYLLVAIDLVYLLTIREA